jgi:mono/diheme cytochrome c family protein
MIQKEWKIGATAFAFAAGVAMFSNTATIAGEVLNEVPSDMMAMAGLTLPKMDAAAGAKVFAAKGCVVCHSVNGIGGEDAPPLDAEYMDDPMNPFDFAAKMWRGAETMVAMQQDELGEVIELTGEDLGNIIAFVHDAEAQAKFSEADIPEEIEEIMHKGD